MTIPVEFQDKMRQLLKTDFEQFMASYESNPSCGLRMNPLKVRNLEMLTALTALFELKPVPWAAEGYYYQPEQRPGKHPFHEAGCYYIQEPSAMAVVGLLDPQPGEKVLDLCAAPGGKTTQIAGRLNGSGFLLSNEVHPQRAKILSQNVERMGIVNAVVTNEECDRLEQYFPDFFDKIVVDAPCSGEGMFRKDEQSRRQWSGQQVESCARRQKLILASAAGMLKPGGRLVYSTCTFSPEEDEGVIEHFLSVHPEFSIAKIEAYQGFAAGHPEWVTGGRKELKETFRIWPHRLKGEGHYLAVLQKDQPGIGLKRKDQPPAGLKERRLLETFEVFCKENLVRCEKWERHRLILFGEHLYALPEQMTDVKGLKTIRPGLHLGTFKKNRFEPAHALALALDKTDVVHSFQMNRDQSYEFLSGAAIQLSEVQAGGSGWTLMLVDGYSVGWSKRVNQQLKNHYPKGLRITSRP